MSDLGIKDLTPCWGQYKFIFDDSMDKWHIVNVTTYETLCLLQSPYNRKSTFDPLPEETICSCCLKQMRENSSMEEIADG